MTGLSGNAVWGINGFVPREHCDRGFEYLLDPWMYVCVFSVLRCPVLAEALRWGDSLSMQSYQNV
jgi:hypothetical protein